MPSDDIKALRHALNDAQKAEQEAVLEDGSGSRAHLQARDERVHAERALAREQRDRDRRAQRDAMTPAEIVDEMMRW